MNQGVALIKKCHELGVTLALGPEGKLRASPPGKLPRELKEELQGHKAELLEALSVVSPSPSLHEGAPSTQTTDWLCSNCAQPVTIDEVCKSLDGQRWLTLYHCAPCELVGVTPDAVKSPPVWVRKTEQ